MILILYYLLTHKVRPRVYVNYSDQGINQYPLTDC